MSACISRRSRRGLKQLVRRIAGLMLRGDRVSCACCARSFRRFLPFGTPRRSNAMCPHCGSLERHRFLALWLERSGKLDAGRLRLLHVAPETAIVELLASRPNVTHFSTDLFDDDVSVTCNVEALPFPGGAFDGIICYHVLEHVGDDRAAMSDLRRALAPGGWALIAVPHEEDRSTTDEDPGVTDPRERLRRFGQRDHVRRYGLDFFDRLREAGFAVEVRRISEVIPESLLIMNAIDGREMFAECTT